MTASSSFPRVAVLGATGLVGTEMLHALAEREAPPACLLPLGSPGRTGRTVAYRGEALPVHPVSAEHLAAVDVVLASAGGAVSREWLPAAVAGGVVAIDNTSAFRMESAVPLVVPEVNGSALDDVMLGSGCGQLIANPNCSTIQLVVLLHALRSAAPLVGVSVATYQAISGAGAGAVAAFRDAARAVLDGVPTEPGAFALDARPGIGALLEDGSTEEERKMVRETPKILGEDLEVDVTCVRVPVLRGHSEAVRVRFETPVDARTIAAALEGAEGLTWHREQAPEARALAGDPGVHVGRVRPAGEGGRAWSFWCVSDNLLKGAATNAVQILDHLRARTA